LAGLERIPRKAERRPDIAELIFEQIARHPFDSVAGGRARDHRLTRYIDVVLRCTRREANLIPQPQIDGQVWFGLPSVLRVKLVLGIAIVEVEGVLGPLIAFCD